MGLPNPGISEEAKAFAQNLPWHGNVRELANAIHKALIFNRGFPIQPEDLSQAVLGNGEHIAPADTNVEKIIRQWLRQVIKMGGSQELFNSLLDKFTCMVLEEALSLTGGNRSRAAKLLGISRPTLHAKMDKCGLSSHDEENQ
jgi:DNA-binding NtrC family response regulator